MTVESLHKHIFLDSPSEALHPQPGKPYRTCIICWKVSAFLDVNCSCASAKAALLGQAEPLAGSEAQSLASMNPQPGGGPPASCLCPHKGWLLSVPAKPCSPNPAYIEILTWINGRELIPAQRQSPDHKKDRINQLIIII